MLPYEALFSDNNGIEFGVTCAGNCKKYRTGNFRRVRGGKNNVPVIRGEKAKHVLGRSRGWGCRYIRGNSNIRYSSRGYTLYDYRTGIILI